MTEERLECFLDGQALCIVENDFVNLQESDSIFLPITPEQEKDIEKLQKGAERKDA